MEYFVKIAPNQYKADQQGLRSAGAVRGSGLWGHATSDTIYKRAITAVTPENKLLAAATHRRGQGRVGERRSKAQVATQRGVHAGQTSLLPHRPCTQATQCYSQVLRELGSRFPAIAYRSQRAKQKSRAPIAKRATLPAGDFSTCA